MNINQVFSWLVRRLLLTLLFFSIFVFLHMIWPLNLKPNPISPAILTSLLLVMCFVNAVIVAGLAYRRSVSKRIMVMGLSIFLFGVIDLQAIDESLFFRDAVNIPVDQQLQLLMMGLINSVLMAMATVWLIQPRKEMAGDKFDWKIHDPKSWFIRIVSVALIFPVIYQFYGFSIAWQSPVVRAFYQNGIHISLITLCSFQIFRGLIWCGLALVALLITRGKRIEQIFYIGLAMGILHSIQIIIPSAYMPPEVCYIHFIELFISITNIGLLAAWMLSKKSDKTPLEVSGQIDRH